MPREFNITVEDYVDISHRLTGFPEEVIKEYYKLKKLSKTEMGALTISDIYCKSTLTELFYLEKKMKIQRLISLSKK